MKKTCSNINIVIFTLIFVCDITDYICQLLFQVEKEYRYDCDLFSFNHFLTFLQAF